MSRFVRTRFVRRSFNTVIVLALLQIGCLPSTTAGGERLLRNSHHPAYGNIGYIPPNAALPDDGEIVIGSPMYGGSCDSCDTCEPSCGVCYEDPCCCSAGGRCGPRWVLYGDHLYLQVTGADVAHAQQQNGLGGAGTVPFGDISTTEMEFNSGFRVGGMIACGPCSGIATSFTHYESDAFTSLDAPVIAGGGGAVGSLVHHPGAALTASVGPVDATYAIDFQLADLMYRGLWRCGPRYEINYLVGAQYGHLDQDFMQSGIFGGGLGGDVDTTTTIDFDGGGLKAGIDAERQLGRGFSIYGRLTAAVMSGRFSNRYSMYNVTTDALLAQSNWKDDRVVSQVEYELGLSLSSMNERWRATAGYMFSHWGNVVTTPEFIDAVQADNYVDVGDTLSFDGFVSRVEYRW